MSNVGASHQATPPGPSQVGCLLEPWDGTPPGRQQNIDLFGMNSFYGGCNSYVNGRQVKKEMIERFAVSYGKHFGLKLDIA